jgi:hypothetical protein
MIDCASKFAFEKDLNSAFNEIWLSRILFDLWDDVVFDETCVRPGMMFRLETTYETQKGLDYRNEYGIGYHHPSCGIELDKMARIYKTSHGTELDKILNVNKMPIFYSGDTYYSREHRVTMESRMLIVTRVLVENSSKTISFRPVWENMSDIETWSGEWTVRCIHARSGGDMLQCRYFWIPVRMIPVSIFD